MKQTAGVRHWINKLTTYVVALGGAAVIGAIALIFLYLLWVVAPMFAGAAIEAGDRWPLQEGEAPLLLDLNESGEIALVINQDGLVRFFASESGRTLTTLELDSALAAAQRVYRDESSYALLDESGALWFLKADYPVSFEGNERRITPAPSFPFEREPLVLDEAVTAFDVTADTAAATLTIATLDAEGLLRLRIFRDAEPGWPLEFPRRAQLQLAPGFERLLFGPRGRWIFAFRNDGTVAGIDINQPQRPRLLFEQSIRTDGASLTTMEPLLGRYSLLVGDSRGLISQWFLVRSDAGYAFERARSFALQQPVVALFPEPRRKGFAALDRGGALHLFHSTSERRLASYQPDHAVALPGVVAPRSEVLVLSGNDGALSSFALHNEHPEISWSSLWSRVWYEGYEDPVYSWQSSSADNDFEPKFSLVPLAFGTLKAAFYAMLFAVPIALMGAVYTAYFMNPGMRRIVKPGIEIMAALPTVILGFLAGLWLAPLIEAKLPGMLAVVLVVPLGMLLFARLWSFLPDHVQQRCDGWYGAVAVPVVVVLIAAALAAGPLLETAVFGGDTKAWLRATLGLDYDQRNALVVGIAMGLAVIPTIFSIAEDAIYGVPTHLTHGSLALGATPWQTLSQVVILTASPGIFSAVMIGLGRAVGETMIVLMATGNTPVMDFNIFQGMRTFAANIAVELPESEVASSHYRILFLAALVLFLITFVFNTIAEVVRQRLRNRYGNL